MCKQRESDFCNPACCGRVLVGSFAMIKPDAVAAGATDAIVKRIKDELFQVVTQQRFTMTAAHAKELYAEHENKPFYHSLIQFMTRLALFSVHHS